MFYTVSLSYVKIPHYCEEIKINLTVSNIGLKSFEVSAGSGRSAPPGT